MKILPFNMLGFFEFYCLLSFITVKCQRQFLGFLELGIWHCKMKLFSFSKSFSLKKGWSFVEEGEVLFCSVRRKKERVVRESVAPFLMKKLSVFNGLHI